MSNIRRAGYAGLLGAFFAIASLLAFPGLLRLVERPDSAIRVEANDVAPGPFVEIKGGEGRQLYIDGASGSLMSPVAPGLHHIAWKQSYRGGHERSVGYAQLVGPFQDPRTPTCGLALLIAPAFLDQTSPVLEKVVARQLKGLSQWPVGDFRNVTDTTMNWIRWEEHPPPKVRRAQVEAPLAGQRLNGHLRVSMNVEFENAMVPLSLMVVPYILGESLKFHIYVNAKLDLDNRFFQWVADVFDGDDRVSRLIDKEVSREMRSVLDKPPDIALEGGGKLQIEFCRGTQLLFHKEGHVAMPLALRVADQSPAPPMFPIADEEYSAVMSTPLAIELDRNALGGVLHTLWASGLLDRTLANTTVRAFNEHPTVRDFLSVRIDGAKFHLPPTIDVIGAGDEGLLLRVASRMSFQDGGQRSQANLFAAFQVDSAFLKNSSSKSSHTAPAIALSALELTCTSSDERLHPCYSQIVAQLRANQEQLEEQLGTRFRDLLLRLFTRRTLTASGAPAKFQLESTEFHLEGTRLRANLSGSVQPER